MGFQKGHPFYKGGEKGWFKKGQVPWSKSQKGVCLNSGRTHFKKGVHSNPDSEFKKNDERLTGEANPKWVGNEVGYFALHGWVSRKLGKANYCTFGGKYLMTVFGTCSKKFEWANKSHEYKRDVNDWMPLCQKCHHRYDDVSQKIWESRRRNGTVKWKKV